jgi:uncharacterized protein YndB with AHSA1/START domain
MATIKSTITINAPVEKVFEYSKPENLPEFWPSLVEVKNIEQLPNGGYRWDWKYKMAGMSFNGSSEHVEFVENQRTVAKSTGIESTITWSYEPVAGGTRMTAETDYKIPGSLLGKVAEGFITKMNENESETILANLKARLEA